MSEAAATSTVPLGQQIRGMKWNFWVANLIESFERLAFFGVRAVVGLYIFGDNSVLHLSMTEKGLIFGIWALIQCLVPMVSGGYTDSYGYRKSMYVAFSINIVGYCLMANAHGFWTMLAAACLVGLGTAIFKPPVQGSVAKSLNEGNSGLGFGIFYWMVNVGGFFAPMMAAVLRGNDEAPTWSYVFYGAAIATAINFIPATFMFREPELDPAAKKKKPWKVFTDTMGTLWRDKYMLRFLLIVSGFWFMFMQLWDLLPNFIDEWVDTRDVGALIAEEDEDDLLARSNADALAAVDPVAAKEAIAEAEEIVAIKARGEEPPEEPAAEPAPAASAADDGSAAEEEKKGPALLSRAWLEESFLMSDGRAKPELLINIDSLTILLLVLPLSWFFGRYRMMVSLVLGMGIGLVGFVGAGLSQAGMVVGLMIFVFAIGEIICSPKFSEYIGMTAPPDKKAIYMGYSNIPFAIGWAGGNWLSGPLYDWLSSRNTLAQRWLVDNAGMAKDVAKELEGEALLNVVAVQMGNGATAWDVKRVLWQTYHPWIIWLVLGVIGLASVVGMYVSYRRAKKTA
jgi:hypothetical protein